MNPKASSYNFNNTLIKNKQQKIGNKIKSLGFNQSIGDYWKNLKKEEKRIDIVNQIRCMILEQVEKRYLSSEISIIIKYELLSGFSLDELVRILKDVDGIYAKYSNINISEFELIVNLNNPSLITNDFDFTDVDDFDEIEKLIQNEQKRFLNKSI
jgi:hypothetical protein